MTDMKEPGEQYTYGERLFRPFSFFYSEGEFTRWGQVDHLMNKYKKYGHGTNQCCLSVSEPADIKLSDPPCLRSIDTKIQDGRLHFFVYFRSWDLWGGFPANLAALQQLKAYMAGQIGVGDGEIVASSKGLHLYDHCWPLAAKIRGKEES